MDMKVEIIAKQIIKPSKPTPFYLKTFKLSLIDQYMLDVPLSVILFYSANIENKQLDHLKKSLSEVLTDFYPLAGRISGHQFVNCDDEGINFIQTQVSGLLRLFVSHPEADKLKQLLPDRQGSKALFSIQANQFECGGLAIAVSISHKLGDASSLCLFANHWAAVSRGERKDVSPIFDTSSDFPPQDDLPQINELPIDQKLVSKRFVFNAANISALKAKISDYGEVPTRVEAISALIWWCVLDVARMRTGVAKPQSLLYFPLNLRGRMVPPQTNSSFGNFVLCSLTKINTENHPGLHSLVAQLRESVKNVDSNYVKQVQAQDGYLAHLALMAEAHEQYLRGELESLSFTSWCRFPFYDTDFGWGEPIWATYTGLSIKNGISLMDTKCGQGVEAWVTLDEEDMAKFQCQPQLIAFSSTSPRID